MRSYRLPLLIVSALVILADRLSKLWVNKHIRVGSHIDVIHGVFQISHVMNTGAAFSLFENLPSVAVRYGLIAFSVIAIGIVGTMLWITARALTMTSTALALILGGALGNLYDRVHLHYVIDFLAVRIIHYDWPDFNVADSCICIGAALLVLEMFRSSDTSATKETA
ncbi:MAG TPA: signal peptidase II [Granulicella sp.]